MHRLLAGQRVYHLEPLAFSHSEIFPDSRRVLGRTFPMSARNLGRWESHSDLVPYTSFLFCPRNVRLMTLEGTGWSISLLLCLPLSSLLDHDPSCLPPWALSGYTESLKHRKKKSSSTEEAFIILFVPEDCYIQFFFFYPLGNRRSDSRVLPSLSTDLIYFMVLAASGLVTSFLPQPWLLPSSGRSPRACANLVLS